MHCYYKILPHLAFLHLLKSTNPNHLIKRLSMIKWLTTLLHVNLSYGIADHNFLVSLQLNQLI